MALAAAKFLDAIYEDQGTVEGTLEIVSAHGKIECTVFDYITGRGIKCELTESVVETALTSFRKRVEVMFLGFLNAEADKLQRCENVLHEAENGRARIVTSAITLAEVIYIKGGTKPDAQTRPREAFSGRITSLFRT